MVKEPLSPKCVRSCRELVVAGRCKRRDGIPSADRLRSAMPALHDSHWLRAGFHLPAAALWQRWGAQWEGENRASNLGESNSVRATGERAFAADSKLVCAIQPQSGLLSAQRHQHLLNVLPRFVCAPPDFDAANTREGRR